MRSLVLVERAWAGAVVALAGGGVAVAVAHPASVGFALLNAAVALWAAIEPRQRRPLGWALGLGWWGEAGALGAAGWGAGAAAAGLAGAMLLALTELARRAVRGRVLRGGPPNG